MLLKIGGKYRPDFGDSEFIDFHDKSEHHKTMDFMSEIVLNESKNQRVNNVMNKIRIKKAMAEMVRKHPQTEMISKNINIMKTFVEDRLRELYNDVCVYPKFKGRKKRMKFHSKF